MIIVGVMIGVSSSIAFSAAQAGELSFMKVFSVLSCLYLAYICVIYGNLLYSITRAAMEQGSLFELISEILNN